MGSKDPIITRLRRIEGQVRGLARMVEESKPCDELLTQLLAVRAALDKVGLEMVYRYLDLCLPDRASAEEIKQARQKLQRTLELVMRMR
jgi:DNA-binding FrmR family transcriptional regulator